MAHTKDVACNVRVHGSKDIIQKYPKKHYNEIKFMAI